ncbi:MAG TPA: hypothetical protein G4N98_01375 [Thermoflexia bacterium]|nr:hypothetical protein [Thermoflexia bacterium]
MARGALFAGLVLDKTDTPVEVEVIGGEAFYVVDNGGFHRHIRSEVVDRQVLNALQEQILGQREAIVEGMMHFIGQEDLFTKAAVERSIDHLDDNLEQLFHTGLPETSRAWLGLMGFQVTINIHGDVVALHFPDTESPED